jgi:predicted 3-demethylubiquinone-9 3-methyltransferase (glyoxalase superfamily)
MVSKNTICLLYDATALDAAKFYAETLPDSAVEAIHQAPGDYPRGQAGRCLDGRVHRNGRPLSRPERGPSVHVMTQ